MTVSFILIWSATFLVAFVTLESSFCKAFHTKVKSSCLLHIPTLKTEHVSLNSFSILSVSWKKDTTKIWVRTINVTLANLQQLSVYETYIHPMGVLKSPAGFGWPGRGVREGGRHPEDDASPTIRKCVQLSVRTPGPFCSDSWLFEILEYFFKLFFFCQIYNLSN